jgi:hypothetical protein
MAQQGGRDTEVMEACNEKFLEQMVTFATHLKGNMLDLILTNVPELFIEVSNEGRLGTSDHYMLLAELDARSGQAEGNTLVRNWWKADWAAMRAELDHEKWEGLEQLSASEAWSVFRMRLDALVEKHVPLTLILTAW